MQSSVEELGNARINVQARSFYVMALPSLPTHLIGDWLMAETQESIQEALYRELGKRVGHA